MPYKVRHKTVYVKRNGRWVALKTHKTVRAAKAHAAALNINVRHK